MSELTFCCDRAPFPCRFTSLSMCRERKARSMAGSLSCEGCGDCPGPIELASGRRRSVEAAAGQPKPCRLWLEGAPWADAAQDRW